MCRTVHALLSTAICGIQMLVRVFMTIILMLENLIRMILQTLYNFISFMLQLLSLLPICVIFLVTTRLKCFMCGGGGPCPVNRGGACDCLMSAAAIVLLFFIFRAVGLLDKIFYKLGYVEATTPNILRFAPTPGDVTECSREDGIGAGAAGGSGSVGNAGGDNKSPTTTPGLPSLPRGGGSLRYDYSITETEIIEYDSTTMMVASKNALTPMGPSQPVTNTIEEIFARLDTNSSDESANASIVEPHDSKVSANNSLDAKVTRKSLRTSPSVLDLLSDHNLTTILYYLV